MELETAFAVIAGVLVVSALAAGVVERAPLSCWWPGCSHGPACCCSTSRWSSRCC